MPTEHEIVAQLGMSKQELLRAVETGVPDQARLDDFYGDVDLSLIWRERPNTGEPPARDGAG